MSGRAARVVGAVLLSLAVFALAGCGGDDGPSASEEYADDVCRSLSRWATDVETTLRSLADSALTVDRDDLESAVEDVRGATKELGDDLEELGPPETDAGNEARRELDDLATTLSAQIDRVEQALESGEGVSAIAATITAAVSVSAGAVNATYQDLLRLEPADELRDAFESSDDCKSLGEQLERDGS